MYHIFNILNNCNAHASIFLWSMRTISNKLLLLLLLLIIRNAKDTQMN